jgi:hypothetical protein
MGCRERSCFLFPHNFFLLLMQLFCLYRIPALEKVAKIMLELHNIAHMRRFCTILCNIVFYRRFLQLFILFPSHCHCEGVYARGNPLHGTRKLSILNLLAFSVIARAFTPAAIPYMELVNLYKHFQIAIIFLLSLYSPPLFTHHTSSTYRLRVLTPFTHH